MNKKRQEVTDFFVKQFDEILPGDKSNGERLRKQLDAMSDAQFENYLRKLGPARTPEEIANREVLPFYCPVGYEHRISIARNHRIVRELGRDLSHRLVMTDGPTGQQYVTPHKYPVYDLIVRRQSQTLLKKRSVPEHNQRVDDLTGQPTALSKGSRISAPELAALASRGLDNTILEFINFRGGNVEGYREMFRRLVEDGECSLESLKGVGKVKSTATASILLNCMHIGNNLDPDTRVPDDAK